MRQAGTPEGQTALVPVVRKQPQWVDGVTSFR
jgi:hypothetical protein